MPFDPSVVSLLPPQAGVGGLTIRWTTTAPPGTLYQVYVDRRLAWSGSALQATIPLPGAKTRIDVGAVGPGEGSTDFSASLDPAPKNRVTLAWVGGTYLDPSGEGDVAGFRVYGERSPGGGVNYDRPLVDLPIGVDGLQFDGYGLGGYGEGGYGFASSAFSWTSPPLKGGVWTFAVRAYDAAGNESEPRTTAAPIAAPPEPPAVGPDRLRLRHTYDPDAKTAALAWLASPG